MIQRIANYLMAGYSGLFLVSHEEGRAETALLAAVDHVNASQPDDARLPKFALQVWSCTGGLVDARTGQKGGCESPGDMLDAFSKAPPNSVYALRDFHLFIEDRNAFLWRRLRDELKAGRASNKTLAVLGCRLTLPPELEKEITVVDFPLPDAEELGLRLDKLVADNGINGNAMDDRRALVSAASGMTLHEAEAAFGLSYIECGRISAAVVYREKCQAVRKNGLLEVVESKITLDDIGGLENLKRWLVERREAFSDAAKAYGLPTPKGMLAVGQPGTGKSLMSKACQSVFNVPLLRLDAAKLFGSLVGQSESNWRLVHATAKAMAPCVLWIDEVDGAMSGGANSGQTDGGTTARVIKSILQDMQDHSEGIFYALTANDVDNLPSPLLRRMDEVWNVELPNATERASIWAIQIRKGRRDPAAFDLPTLVAASDGYSGAEIEKLVAQSLYRGFAAKREPTTADLVELMATFSPLSKTMAADIERRRKRLDGVAKPASGVVAAAPIDAGRRLAVAGRN